MDDVYAIMNTSRVQSRRSMTYQTQKYSKKYNVEIFYELGVGTLRFVEGPFVVIVSLN